jgi:hypothetical protein
VCAVSGGATPRCVLEIDRVFVVQISGYQRLGFLLLTKRGLPAGHQADELRDLVAAGRRQGERRTVTVPLVQTSYEGNNNRTALNSGTHSSAAGRASAERALMPTERR